MSAVAWVPGLLGNSSAHVELRLAPSWDGQLTAESLNASMVVPSSDGGSSVHLGNWEQTSSGEVVEYLSYQIEPGDVLDAELVDDRARLTLRTRLHAATLRQGCSYEAAPSTAPASERMRTVTVDLPYRALPMELALTASAQAICPGECVDLSASVTHGAIPYRFEWDHDLPDGSGPHRICPTRTASYTLRAIDASGERRFASVAVAVRSSCAGEPAAPVPLVDCSAELQSSMGVSARFTPTARGDVYLWGFFVGDVLFGADGSLRNAVENLEDGSSFFIAKYTGCSYAWSRNLGQGWHDVTLAGLAVDPRGDAVLTGNYQGRFDPLLDVPLPGQERGASFVARLSPDGEVLREVRLPIGILSSVLDGDGEPVLIASAPSGTDLGQGSLVMDGGDGPVLVKLDADYRVVFTRALGGATSAAASVSADGTIHVVGHAQEHLRVEGAQALSPGNSFDFLLRVSSAGQLESQTQLPPRPTHALDPYNFTDISIVGVDESGAVLVTRICSGGPNLPPARQEIRVNRDGSLAFEAVRLPSLTSFSTQDMGFEWFEDGTYSAFTLRTFANSDLTRVLRRELVRETYDLRGQRTSTTPILDLEREATNLYRVQATPRGELLVSSGEQRRERFHLVLPMR